MSIVCSAGEKLRFLRVISLVCSDLGLTRKQHPQSGSKGKMAHLADSEACLYCKIHAVPIDFDGSRSDAFQFDCLTEGDEESVLDDVPYQIDLPQDFLAEHMIALRSGLSTICIRGGRTTRFPNSTIPHQVVIPEGADIELLPSLDPNEGDGLGFGNRTVLVVRVSGTSESPYESVEEVAGAVFGLGSQPLANSMRAQFQRCSFSKIDFAPASGFDELYNGVVNVQLDYSLRGRRALQVFGAATEAVGELLNIRTLSRTFDHVIFCIAKGTTYQRSTEWLAFAHLGGYTSVFNSGRCDSLSALMHEIGHNLGLLHSADDIIGSAYRDTSGMVSFHWVASSLSRQSTLANNASLLLVHFVG